MGFHFLARSLGTNLNGNFYVGFWTLVRALAFIFIILRSTMLTHNDIIKQGLCLRLHWKRRPAFRFDAVSIDDTGGTTPRGDAPRDAVPRGGARRDGVPLGAASRSAVPRGF